MWTYCWSSYIAARSRVRHSSSVRVLVFERQLPEIVIFPTVVRSQINCCKHVSYPAIEAAGPGMRLAFLSKMAKSIAATNDPYRG